MAFTKAARIKRAKMGAKARWGKTKTAASRKPGIRKTTRGKGRRIAGKRRS